ncbi:MAG: hypothetical protein WC030_03555 [Candidatus Paceibacterota bacterium]
MDGYKIGQKPPGLEADGSFDTPAGVRATSIVDEDTGDILSVDRTTGLLAVDESIGEDDE